MSESKVSLAYHNKSKDCPLRGTPEFEEWVQEKARKQFEEIFSDEYQAELEELYQDDPDMFKGMLCGDPNFLSLPPEEQEAIDIASEKRFLEEQRKHLKVIK